MKKIRRNTLVEVHLLDGKVLTNLFLSHRTFGKDLVFYDTKDQYQQNLLTISKEHIQMILSIEHSTDKESDVTEEKLKDFSSRTIQKE